MKIERPSVATPQLSVVRDDDTPPLPAPLAERNTAWQFLSELKEANGPWSEANAVRLAQLVARDAGVTYDNLVGRDRRHVMKAPRVLLYVMLVRHFAWSVARIAKIFNRDHTTVLYLLNQYGDSIVDKMTTPEVGSACSTTTGGSHEH